MRFKNLHPQRAQLDILTLKYKKDSQRRQKKVSSGHSSATPWKYEDKKQFFAPVPDAIAVIPHDIPLQLTILCDCCIITFSHTHLYIIMSFHYYCSYYFTLCLVSLFLISSSFALTVLILWNEFLVNLIAIFVNFQYVIGRLFHRDGIHAGHRNVTMWGR